MYLLMGWQLLPSGGFNDLLKICDTEAEALLLIDKLEASGEDWQTQIVDCNFKVIFESGNYFLESAPDDERPH